MMVRWITLALLVTIPTVALAQSLPTSLTLTPVNDTTFDIDWTNNGTYDELVLSIRSMTSGSEFVIGQVAGNDVRYRWQTQGTIADAYQLQLTAFVGAVPLGTVAGPLTGDLCPPLYGAAPPPFAYPPAIELPNDPLFHEQWSLNNYGQYGPGDVDIDVLRAWTVEQGCSRVIVGTAEFGAAWDHPELVNRLTPGYDFSSGTPDPGGYDPDRGPMSWDPSKYVPGQPYSPATTGNGQHAPAVHGIIAAEGNNGIGIAGIAGGLGPNSGVRIMPFKYGTITPAAISAIECCGSCDASEDLTNYLASVLEYCTLLRSETGAEIRVVTSTSPSGFGNCSALEDRIQKAITRARKEGILFVQSAGNSGPGTITPLATLDDTLVVGNLSLSGNLYSTSATGPEIDLVAPGSQVLTLSQVGQGDSKIDPSRNYVNSVDICGTSFSGPAVAAAAALIFSHYPGLTVDQVEEALLLGADDLGPPGPDAEFGYGRLNVYRSLMYAESLIGTVPFEIPGDLNLDGIVDSTDVTLLGNYVLTLAPFPAPSCMGDVDGNGTIDAGDFTFLLASQIQSGPEPLIGCPFAWQGCP